jgi:hypothetical protein
MRLARIWFDQPRVRWRIVIASAAIATGLIALWIAHHRELWSAQEVVVAVAPRIAAAASIAAPAPVRRGVVLAKAAPQPASAVAAARPPRSSDACGLGDATAPDDAALERRARALQERWITTMQTSGDERLRAAGWMLGSAETRATLRDRLATLAATSRDPLVQAFALRACRTDAASSSACQALSPETWARLEVDNAAAWLAVAADPRVDLPAQLEALQQAGRAGQFDTHASTLHALVQAAQPVGVSDYDRVTMAREVVNARADWLGTEALRLHCGAVILTDSDRRSLCEHLADMLATRAQTVPDLLQAREIGQRVGWKEERLDALRDEADALTALERRSFESADTSSCTALARQSSFFADVGRLGEVGALRQALQRGTR